MEIRARYAELEERKHGRTWTGAEIAQGFVGDVGELMKLVMAKEGLRDKDNLDELLEHEIADCLWSILVLSHLYKVDLEQAFFNTMKELDARIDKLA